MLVRDQFFVLLTYGERAVDALADMVPEADARVTLLKKVDAILGAGDLPSAAEHDRVARLSQVLAPRDRKQLARPSPLVAAAG
jgi:hypothetical protein